MCKCDIMDTCVTLTERECVHSDLTAPVISLCVSKMWADQI